MMAGLLLARAGVSVRVLEKHSDFLRDFRGDTVHPSTMEILDQLGILGPFLERPHNRISTARLRVAGREWAIGDLSHLETAAPFIAMMPQWDFLDFLRDQAAQYPGFALEMEAPVHAIIVEDGRIAGARLADGSERRADLTIAADGRDSIVRRERILQVETLGAPMDILWFKLPKVDDGGDALRGSIETGRMVVLIDRDDYWQAAMIIPKGQASAVVARGMDRLREDVREAFPGMEFPEGALVDESELHLLSVALDRLPCWSRAGLLAIGDAAHAMSPIGGVGINLAIQDAVAAANVLAAPLARGEDIDPLLHRVQDRRLLPTRMVQAGQRAFQDRVIGAVLGGRKPIEQAPLVLRLLDRYPMLRRIPGRMIGLGIRRERVRSPNAYA